MLKFVVLLVCLCSALGAQPDLEVFDDDGLLNLFRNEKYVIVLFTKKACEDCENLENALISIREDLVDTLNAWVVKAVNSQLVRLYSPSKEPALVFFRHGVPLLYDGAVDEELIMHTFTDNKEPVVRELSDENFESLTQAASGATTGDWFIMFYATDCIDCQRLQARWEAVGAKLKTRLNVARINRQTTGRVTARRFRVIETPTFLFFRLGKMYHYNIPKYDVPSFVSFATDWYKNARAEKVPLPKTPFDDLTQQIADYIRENPWLWKLGSITVCITIILSVIKRLKTTEKEQKKKEKQEKQEKTEKSKKSK